MSKNWGKKKKKKAGASRKTGGMVVVGAGGGQRVSRGEITEQAPLREGTSDLPRKK